VLTRLLVDAGADIKGLDESNRTPLEIAKRYGHKKAVALLQSQGAV
jgi:ankyrin repeat protein